MAEQFQLREVFNPALVKELAGNIGRVWVEFEEGAFVEAIVPRLPELNFGARSSLIADSLRRYLPDAYETAVSILIATLPPELTTDFFTGYDGFEIMPQCLFVSRYGLDNYDVSINALYEMTKRFTAEGDIRPSSLMIDTVIHYMKANGQQKAKVFKAAKRSIGPGETIVIERARSFKVINTRPYYAGKHALEIQINGKRHAWLISR